MELRAFGMALRAWVRVRNRVVRRGVVRVLTARFSSCHGIRGPRSRGSRGRLSRLRDQRKRAAAPGHRYGVAHEPKSPYTTATSVWVRFEGRVFFAPRG
jgi:hypothetical protein